MNTTEHAAVIRSELKKLGFSSRQVSVRAEYFSMGSSIDIRIKDATVPIATVEKIAEPAESVRRCESSGEILSGGNRYVSVCYTSEALTVIGSRFVEPVQKAADAIEVGSNSLVKVEGTDFLVGRPDQWSYSLWRDSFICKGAVEEIARTIGVRSVGK